MSEFKIEKDIPYPTKKLDDLAIALIKTEVGDSIFVKTEEMDYYKIQRSIDKASYNGGGRFSRRSVEGGVRIWRITK